MPEDIKSVPIRPNSSILAVLSHLNYKAWYALAEYVDNSVQSYAKHREELRRLEGETYRLKVDITINPEEGIIVVRDNAAGIAASEFKNAFKPAQPPADRSGLSEFGMGMKTASCWFGHRWTVRTSALGEAVERTVRFDVEQIKATEVEELSIEEEPAEPGSHFTEIVLECYPNKIPQRRTLGKVKDHIRSMYRRFTGRGDLLLKVNGEVMDYEEPEVLVYPVVDSDGEPTNDIQVRWQREFSFEFGERGRAAARVGILRRGDTSRAGFSLFRRNRLIVGSADETYRPQEVFGRSNSYAYQRVFGDIDIDGVDVTHTKDGFEWQDYEEEFIEKLIEELQDPALDILRQADWYRVKIRMRNESDILRDQTNRVADSVQDALQNKVGPDMAPAAKGEEPQPPPAEELSVVPTVNVRQFEVQLDDLTWRVKVEVTDDPAVGEFVEVAQREESPGISDISYRLSLQHPFVRKHLGVFNENLDLFYRMAAAVAVAEAAAITGGNTGQARRMRRYIGRVLKHLVSS